MTTEELERVKAMPFVLCKRVVDDFIDSCPEFLPCVLSARVILQEYYNILKKYVELPILEKFLKVYIYIFGNKIYSLYELSLSIHSSSVLVCGTWESHISSHHYALGCYTNYNSYEIPYRLYYSIWRFCNRVKKLGRAIAFENRTFQVKYELAINYSYCHTNYLKGKDGPIVFPGSYEFTSLTSTYEIELYTKHMEKVKEKEKFTTIWASLELKDKFSLDFPSIEKSKKVLYGKGKDLRTQKEIFFTWRPTTRLIGDIPFEISFLQSVGDVAPKLLAWERVKNDEEDRYLVISERMVFAPPNSDKEKLVMDLISLLNRMKDRGVLHRDIKPEHICFHPETGEMKLIDFDSSIFIKDIPDNLEFGTPGFLAPEIEANNFQKYDEKIDIYSAGVALKLALVGRDIVDPVLLQKEFESLSDVSQHTKELVQAMTEPDPEKRISHNELGNNPTRHKRKLSNTGFQ